MDELKLCPVPWCERVNKPEFYNPEPKAYCVACPDCGLETNVFATEAEAIAAWNTRAEASSAEPVADIAGYERGQRETVARIVAWIRTGAMFAYTDQEMADAIEAGEWK